MVKKPPRRFSQVVAWADETVEQVIEAHPEEYRLIPTIGSAAGLRQGELFGLALEDLDFDEGVIRVRHQIKRLGQTWIYGLPKNDKERIVPMPSRLAELAKEHIATFGTQNIRLPWERVDGELRPYELLFTWGDDRAMRADLYNLVIWKPAIAAAGVIPPPVKDQRGRKRYVSDYTAGMHALRHYFASITLADGVNIKELSEYLGHYDPGFTLRMYTHMLPSSHDRESQAVNRRLERLGLRLTEQRRSRAENSPGYDDPDLGPGLA
ncbi:site-specific integrase [Kribbella yunnanensis]|uniref:tyrosine-type recombinase/integrase n=1 Tax=Kribbella yunnanensis TaxID=190194 RepID=UPI0031D10FC6